MTTMAKHRAASIVLMAVPFVLSYVGVPVIVLLALALTGCTLYVTTIQLKP